MKPHKHTMLALLSAGHIIFLYLLKGFSVRNWTPGGVFTWHHGTNTHVSMAVLPSTLIVPQFIGVSILPCFLPFPALDIERYMHLYMY